MKLLLLAMNFLNRKEVAMFDTLHLTNMLRLEVESIPETGLPLDAFPDKIQEIILNLARYENFNVEYTASIILSAVATAIGNSCHIRIKGEWKTCPSLYMMLVGRPGLGKTPPLGFIYKPINEYDDRLHEKYNEEYDEYERAMSAGKHGTDGEERLLKKPNFITTVIYDSTPEAMMNIHQHNQRGITLVVDEILALFNSVKRYNSKNNLIEDLLTAYSGQPLKIIRKSESRPVLIKNPCINVIGSVQTNMLQEVFRTEFLANGLLDRFLFVYPKNRKISGWRREEINTLRPDIMNQWRTIINRVFSIPCILDDKGTTVNPRILTMSDDAEECFYEWYNGIIDAVNAIEDDADVEETEEVSEQKHQLEKKVDKYANIIFGSDDPEEKTGEEVDDEELVRAKAKKNKFDSGYDFFDEAPKKSMGVIKSSDLRDAEDFDVIGEVERKAETVKQNALEKENNKETEGEQTDKRSTEEVLANVGKNIGNALRGFAGGVKNFGIHCGYFCKNVSIMIKRKRAIAKRKKAEEERRERERQKAERARMRAERGESDGLVQVHSRTDRRPQQNRRPANRNKRR